MKVIRLILPVLLLASTGFAQKVWSKFQPAADFTKYKTYKWVPIQSTDQIDALANQQLKAAVDAELAKKGLIKTEGAEADLFVGYQVAFRKQRNGAPPPRCQDPMLSGREEAWGIRIMR